MGRAPPWPLIPFGTRRAHALPVFTETMLTDVDAETFYEKFLCHVLK